MSISLDFAKRNLTLWLEADAAVAGNQSYSIGGQSLTRANAAEITEKIKFWERKVATLESGRKGPRVYHALPR